MVAERLARILFEFLIAGSGAAAIILLVVHYYSKSWLDHLFGERLQAFKHEQELMMERYQQEIETLFARFIRIQEKEIEILPAAWRCLQDALGSSARLNRSPQYAPDLNSMTAEQAAAALSRLRLPDEQKDAIRQAPDRNAAYQKAYLQYALRDARKAADDLHKYLAYNKIFFPKELFESFTVVDQQLGRFLEARERAEVTQNQGPESLSLLTAREELLATVDMVELQIQRRLHYTDGN